MSTRTMHAIQVHDYGDADQLKLEEITVPEPEAGEVLVRVYAAGVNPADWKVRSGYFKASTPTTMPYIPRADLAGVVEKDSPGVRTFQPAPELCSQRSNISNA